MNFSSKIQPRKNIILFFAMMFCLLSTVIALAGAWIQHETVYAGENIWTWANVGGYVEQIITDPLSPGLVYARMGDGKLMKSTDGGISWINIADPSWANLFRITMAYDSPDVLYARTSAGTYVTTNGGASWQLVYPPKMVTGVAVSPTDWKTAYLANALSYNSTVISRTLDGGQTWSTWSINLPDGLSLQDDVGAAITISPSAPHIMIVKQANTTPGASLYKSMDGGQTWSELAGPYDNVGVVTFDPKNSDTIYIGSYFSPGGWKSTDGGVNWIPMANGLQSNGRAFVIDPDNTQVIYAANGAAGVLESLDGGASWTPINTGIQGLEVNCIAIASRNPLVIYAGLAGGGIWKMTRTTVPDYSITINSGALFTNQTAVNLTLTAPPGTTQMMISNDGGFSGAAWEAFTTQKSWTITEYGDYPIPRTVYAKFKTSGQTSGLYQDDVILDRTAPTGSVIITETVNSSASLNTLSAEFTSPSWTEALTNTVYLPTILNNARPGYMLVGLDLSATDDLSGVGEVLVSNQSDFADAQWEAHATQMNWWVPNAKTTTVYVKYRDRAGNESTVYSDTVTP